MAHCVPVDGCPGTAARAEADIRVGGNRLSPSLSIAGHRAVMARSAYRASDMALITATLERGSFTVPCAALCAPTLRRRVGNSQVASCDRTRPLHPPSLLLQTLGEHSYNRRQSG